MLETGDLNRPPGADPDREPNRSNRSREMWGQKSMVDLECPHVKVQYQIRYQEDIDSVGEVNV